MAFPKILAQNKVHADFGTVTTSAVSVSGVIANVTNYKTAERITFAGVTSNVSWMVDAGVGVTISADSYAVMGHNLNTAGVSQIILETSANGSAWNTEVTKVVDDDRLLFDTFTGVSARFWRFRFVGASVAVRIAISSIGSVFTFTEGMPKGWDDLARQIQGEAVYTRNGAFSGSSIRYARRPMNFRIAHMAEATSEAFLSIVGIDHILQIQPFFLSWDIDNHADRVVLGEWDVRRGGKFGTPFFSPVRRVFTMPITAQIESGQL